MLFLEAEDPEKDILLYINSPGGSITAGLAIYDTMQFIRPDVQTYCLGQAASMGALLLAGGAKGKRFSLPNSRIVIHQPLMQGLPDGSAYGIKQKIGQYNVVGKLPLRNLFAAGQSAVLPGVIGAMMSSLIVGRTVLGKDRYGALVSQGLCS